MSISQAEQYLIELINRARLDPLAEAARYGLDDLNAGLPSGTISGLPLQPLAPNQVLHNAAQAHSEWMLATDTFSHTGQSGSSATQRIAASGYELIGYWRTGENLSWRGTTGQIDLDAAIDQHHQGLFLSDGHRRNLLNDGFREIGIAQVQGQFTAQRQDGTWLTYNSSMLTEKFAASGSDVFLTGVVYQDTDKDGTFSIGEGRDGATFRIAGSQADSQAAGGYSLETRAGADKTITIQSGSLDATVRIDLSDGNAKLDLVNGNTLLSSADLNLVTGVTQAGLLGAGDLALTGSGAGDMLSGNQGDNVIHGAAGQDRLTGSTGDDTLYGGHGNDILYGEDDDDRLMGGTGFDTLDGGAGEDTLDGGLGFDLLLGGAGEDYLYGKDQNDRLFGGAGADRIAGQTGSDTLDGGSGNDLMAGGAGDDVLDGGTGFDLMRGEAGNDRLNGGLGHDRLFGGVGFDTLDGGAGEDRLHGGLGADRFVFSDGHGRDVIADFEVTNRHEFIDLSGLSTVTSYADLVGNHMTQSGSDVVITAGSDRLTIKRMEIEDLDASNFLF